MTGAESSPSPLVGRGAEQDLLARHRHALADGRGALVLISGDAGIGKTALALASGARARAAGAAFAAGGCYERGVAPPFAAWHDLLAGLRAAGALDPADLPPPFGAGPTVPTAYQLMQAVVTRLRAAAGRRPLVLLLDDLHWSDQETLELLDLATRHLETTPLLVLGTYRADEALPGRPLTDFLPQLRRNRPVSAIRLGPLSLADTAHLVEARLGPCSPGLAAYLHGRAEGNALFLSHLLDDLIEHGLLTRNAAGRWHPPAQSVPAPAILQEMIDQRLARVEADPIALLETAAVVGPTWDLAVVEAVLAWPEARLLPALETVLASGVVVPAATRAERYRFAHGLVRDVLYDRQLARRRKHLHARVVEVLAARGPGPDGGADPAALAEHALAAEDWPRAVQASLAAGDEARRHAASHGALRYYQQALDALARLPAPDRGTERALHERCGEVRIVLHQHEQAEAEFRCLLDLARAAGDQPAAGRALCWLSLIQRRRFQLEEARHTAEAARQVAEAAGDQRLLALSHWNLGHSHKIAGALAPAEHHLARAERLARAEGQADLLGLCLQNLAQIATWQGDYTRALAQAREAVAVLRASHDPLALGGAYWVLGIAYGERGQYEAARAALQAGLDHSLESGERHFWVRLLNTMGWLYHELGDSATAVQWDEQALAAARRDDADPVTEAERYTLLNLASDRIALGELAAAEAHLRAFLHRLDDGEYSRLRYLNRSQLVRAELALARGDGAAALQAAEEAVRLAQANGVRKNLARGWLLGGRALLALGRPREAVDRLRRAVALADELAHGSLRWQARWWLSQAHLAHRQAGPAAAAAREARDHLDALAAELTDDALRGTLLNAPLARQAREAATALSAPAAAAAHDYPAGLSEREVEVLRLVAQGATNQEIAKALSISVKTVNAHMTNILNKTACANRAAATSFAMRHGLV